MERDQLNWEYREYSGYGQLSGGPLGWHTEVGALTFAMPGSLSPVKVPSRGQRVAGGAVATCPGAGTLN